MRTRIIIVTLGIALTTACKSTKQNDPCLANVAKRDTIIPPPPAPKEATALALFCPDKKSMSFMNATFLANVAALQYSHYKVAGPAMEKLGFGSPGDGDKFYTKWLIHRIKLINEKTKSIDDTWADEVGRLAALAAVTKLYEDLAKTAYIDDGTTSGQFEDVYIHGVNNDKIQFLYGKSSGLLGASTQATFAENVKENYSIIAFRGTQTDQAADIVDDINILYSSLEGMGKVHSGFTSGLGEVEDRIMRHTSE